MVKNHEFVTLVLLLTYPRHKQEYDRLERCLRQELVYSNAFFPLLESMITRHHSYQKDNIHGSL